MFASLPIAGLQGTKGMRWMLAGVLAFGVLSMNAGRGTLAYFTTQVQSTGNTFTAGNLHFAISDSDESSVAPSVTNSISLRKMKPGDVVTAGVRVENTGTIAARYGISYATSIPTGSTQNFAPGLTMAIKGSGAHAATTVADCTTANFSDATLFPASVRTAAAAVAAGETIVSLDPADPTTGRKLDIPAGAQPNEVLCLQVVFPEPGSANNTYNAAVSEDWGTTFAFTFDGLAQ
jgi:predicted ribosomally synthesized peptide with SipW-like signal peptide